MTTIIEWPIHLLTPGQVVPSMVPFTRSGGTTLGGITPSTRTDLGFWKIDYNSISLRNRTRDQWQAWQAIRQNLGGRSGMIIVPVRSARSAPYASGRFEAVRTVPHSDGSPFSDGTEYVQGAISAVAVGSVSTGATSIRIRVVSGDENVVGVRFSHGNALYETGPVMSISGDVWTVPIWPSVRATIPDGAYLDFDRPTCVCHLADDSGMDAPQNSLVKNASVSVSFVEAVDHWSA